MTIEALQHVFSSVERGYIPSRGRGFQTVALSRELAGSDDLPVLERAAVYAVSRERRQEGPPPVKETFYRLPSGRFVVGRTVDMGTDSLGREGNYLSHQLVLTREAMLDAGGDPFRVLSAVSLADTSTGVTAGELPALLFEPAPEPQPPREDEDIPGEDRRWLAELARTRVGRTGGTTLLVGDEARSRALLEMLFLVLPCDDRLQLTFSSHFYESENLRPLFAVATVGSMGEAPAGLAGYAVFNLTTGDQPLAVPGSRYAEWLGDCIEAGRWRDIRAITEALNRRASGSPMFAQELPPLTGEACEALWERTGPVLARSLLLNRAWMMRYLLPEFPSRPALADALLDAATPEQLCGDDPTTEEAEACIAGLRQAASAGAWRRFLKRWEGHATLQHFTRSGQPWWKRLLPG